MSRSNDGLPMLPPWLADTEVTGVGEGNFRNYEPPPVQNLPQDEVIPETPEPPDGFFARRGRGEDRAAESDKKKGKGWFRNKNKDQPSLEERVGELLPNNSGPRPAQRNNWAEATGRHEWATPRPEGAESARHAGADPSQQAEQGTPAPYPPADRPDVPAPPAPGPGPQWGPDGAPAPTAAPNAFRAPATDPPEQPGEPAPEFDRLRPHHPIPPQPAPEPRPTGADEWAAGAAGPAAPAPTPPPLLPPLPDPPADTSRPDEGPAPQQPLRRLPDLPPSPSEATADAGTADEPAPSAESSAPASPGPADAPVPAPDSFTAPDTFTAPEPSPAPEAAPAPEPYPTPDPFRAPESTAPPA
ncbi:hypothetical protein ACLML9_10215, partial [Nocardia sp. NPDC002869]